MTTQTLVYGGDSGRWDQAIYAFLAEKERRSGSMRTVRAYSGMLYRFLIRMSLVSANPYDQLERPKATPAPPRGLTASDIKKLLDFIPDNPVGL